MSDAKELEVALDAISKTVTYWSECNTCENQAEWSQKASLEWNRDIIAPKHQPLISLKTNGCAMLTRFTLISGIKKNSGCNAWKKGGGSCGSGGEGEASEGTRI